MSEVYTYQLVSDEPLKLLVIDPATLSDEQKDLLLKATEGYKRGVNYWSMEREVEKEKKMPNGNY